MPLIPSTLKAALLAAFQAAKNDTTANALDTLCTSLSTAIDTYIKTATVTTTDITVCEAGAGTGTGTGTLS
jgi:hypothetical protein